MVIRKSLVGGMVSLAQIVMKEKYNTITHCSIGHITYEKNPLCAAEGLAMIDFLKDNKLAENANILNNYLLDELKKLQQQFLLTGNFTGKRFHLGIYLVRNRSIWGKAVEETKQIMYTYFDQGVTLKKYNNFKTITDHIKR